MFPTAFAHSLPLSLVSAALFGIGSGAWAILHLAAVTTYFGRRNLGTVLGRYLCIFNLTGFSSPALTGFLLGAIGDWTVQLLLLGVVSLVGALSFLLMGEPRTVPAAPAGRRDGRPIF
ncbi:MAG: MFS transporter [Chloroflexi bacterium]|nr:MFS transporter [Chloroflexota bacterium]MYD49023.1 MFS transporter [Chloroflexota bacterium]